MKDFYARAPRWPLLSSFLLWWLCAPPLAIAGAPPPNDDCASATVISVVPLTDSVSTAAATTEPTDPTLTIVNNGIPCGGGSSDGGRGKSVWYVFTAPTDGVATADTFGSDYDTILSVYTGSCKSFQPISGACNDDDPPCGCNDDDAHDGAQSKVSVLTAENAVHYFMVSAFDNDGGNLVFHFTFVANTEPTPSPSSTATATRASSPTRTNTSIALTTMTATATLSASPLSPTPTPSAGATTATPTSTVVPVLSADPNCDGRTTAADLPAEITLIVDGTRAPCGLDDTNDDGVLDTDDIPGVVTALFTP